MTGQEARTIEKDSVVIWDGDTEARGTVRKISDVGFFVSWNNGKDGWIHYNDAERIEFYQGI